MSKTAYFDVTFGASGDMMLASFIDLGMPEQYLIDELNKLPLPEFRLKANRVIKNGFAAQKLDIECPVENTHRDFSTIKEMINESSLCDNVKELSVEIFEHLAKAEAQVHGKEIDNISFHEIGALDSIIDIVGIASALRYFDVTKAFHSAIPLCGGTVESMHGTIPAMSPAAGILLKGRKFYLSGITTELITPTAAAVLNLLASDENADQSFTYQSIGCGAGSKNFDSHPNIMRIFLGERAGSEENIVTMIETNIDNMNPQLFGFLFDELFKCKVVLDAFIVPVIMKKSRPAQLLKVLINNAYFKEVTNIIFKNTTTIGIRYSNVDRLILSRVIETINTKFGEFSVKLSKSGDKLLNASCEYEECKAAAQKLDLTLKEILNSVNSEIQKKYF